MVENEIKQDYKINTRERKNMKHWRKHVQKYKYAILLLTAIFTQMLRDITNLTVCRHLETAIEKLSEDIYRSFST